MHVIAHSNPLKRFYLITYFLIVMIIHLTGAHFKKWCMMESKIKSGAINEVCIAFVIYPFCHVIILSINFYNKFNDIPTSQYKKEVDIMLEGARSYIKLKTSGGETDNITSSPIIQENR